MWLLFMLAALLMLVAGVGGSYVVKMRPEMVPLEAFQYLPLAENIAYCVGISLCLFGVAMCYRKLRWVGRRGRSGRSGRTRSIDFPRKGKEVMVELEPADDDAPPSEQPTLLFGNPGGDEEPGTKKMRKIGGR